ncbi:MAG: MATE family efflux transporter [Bacteroidaceae bacterium]|nr:MATE family efflux transporter [Bacteroidaceae bacterium]
MRNSIFHIQSSIFSSPILRLALPSVVTNITVPLLGLVDTTIVGHMGRAEYIGAIAIGTTIFNMLYWLFAFLRMGTTGIVSQAFGAGDQRLVSESLRRSLLWALLIALGLIVLQTPLLRFSLWLMKPETTLAQYASEYFRVCIWGAPAMLASYSLTGWFIGMQDTRTPMWMAILQNLTNILCTLLFVFVLHLGVRGVALGTVVGIYMGVLTAPLLSPLKGEEFLRMLLRKDDRRDKGLGESRPLLPSLGGVGGGLFLRTLCLIAVTVYFTTAGSRLGGLYLDANALLMQFFIVFSYFTDGLANAAEALSGEYVGRRDREGLLRVVRQLFLWGFGLALVFTALYASCGSLFLSLLTNQQAVVQTAHAYLPWVIAIPLVAFCAFVWDGVYIGMTRTTHMFVSMLVSALVFFASWFLLHHFTQSQADFRASQLGNHALWFSFLAYLATRSLMQTVLFSRGGRVSG